MRLIFLYGMPASGKLTVARELAAITGYKLFHNHLVVDTLLSVFEFGSAPFIELREEMWLAVFRRAAASGIPGLIFTFAPEPTVRAQFLGDAIEAAGGKVDFVQLVCPVKEIKQRLVAESRGRFGKLTDLALFERLYDAGAFETSKMPAASVTVDTSLVPPQQAAEEIVHALRP